MFEALTKKIVFSKGMHRNRNEVQAPGEKVMSLAMVAKGRSVKVVSVLGGHGMQNKLAAMGIARGQDVQVISNYGGGPLVVAVLDSRVMLGRGMANKILVG